MNKHLKMDAPQPRVLDETRQGILGKGISRTEGPKKVSGSATYAGDNHPEGMAHGVLLRAGITKGKVTGFDESEAKQIDGYLGLFHGPKFIRNNAQGMANEAPVQPDCEVHYHSQPIGLVVAETFEAARDAALAIKVSYAEEGALVDPKAAPQEDQGGPDVGDLEADMGRADVIVDEIYTTEAQVSAAMELHGSVAQWNDGKLLLQSSLQMLKFNRNEIADAVGVDPENVRILAPYVGGGFGSKLGIGADAVSAAIAARELGRPVRVIMPRQTVFDAVLRRTETEQRVRLGARSDGTITSIGHDDLVSNLEGEGFAEPTSQASQFLYAAPNRKMQQTVSRNHRTPSGSVRAPGEAVGMLGLEVAMDELAERLGMCPVKLRLQNVPERDPDSGVPFTAHSLTEALKRGAQEFGWKDRKSNGTRREGEWLIGMGVASAARKNMLLPAKARVTLDGGKAVVETDMTDIGTGSYTIFAQITAEALGLPIENVEVRLADTDYPEASGSGGSFGASSTGSAVFLACQSIREEIAAKCGANDFTLKDGHVAAGGKTTALTDLLDVPLSAVGEIEKGQTSKDHLSSGFGAHFAEVAVNEVSGEVRVRRMLGVFGAGRILNEKTAKSQLVGGMIWGIGAALTEEAAHDPRTGHIITRDLANYHVASHADVPEQIDTILLEERDDYANPIQAKGVGELGISGAGAAVLNAIYNACGVRVRSFPATPDKVMAGLEAM